MDKKEGKCFCFHSDLNRMGLGVLNGSELNILMASLFLAANQNDILLIKIRKLLSGFHVKCHFKKVLSSLCEKLKAHGLLGDDENALFNRFEKSQDNKSLIVHLNDSKKYLIAPTKKNYTRIYLGEFFGLKTPLSKALYCMIRWNSKKASFFIKATQLHSFLGIGIDDKYAKKIKVALKHLKNIGYDLSVFTIQSTLNCRCVYAVGFSHNNLPFKEVEKDKSGGKDVAPSDRVRACLKGGGDQIKTSEKENEAVYLKACLALNGFQRLTDNKTGADNHLNEEGISEDLNRYEKINLYYLGFNYYILSAIKTGSYFIFKCFSVRTNQTEVIKISAKEYPMPLDYFFSKGARFVGYCNKKTHADFKDCVGKVVFSGDGGNSSYLKIKGVYYSYNGKVHVGLEDLDNPNKICKPFVADNKKHFINWFEKNHIKGFAW